jgi:hypothetical protein
MNARTDHPAYQAKYQSCPKDYLGVGTIVTEPAFQGVKKQTERRADPGTNGNTPFPLVRRE